MIINNSLLIWKELLKKEQSQNFGSVVTAGEDQEDVAVSYGPPVVVIKLRPDHILRKQTAQQHDGNSQFHWCPRTTEARNKLFQIFHAILRSRNEFTECCSVYEMYNYSLGSQYKLFIYKIKDIK